MFKTTPFNEILFNNFKKELSHNVLNAIKKKGESLISINIDNYENELFNKYKIAPLNIQFDKKEKDIGKHNISGANFPRGYDVYRNSTYEIETGIYKIPFSGDYDLIKIKMQYPYMPNIYDISYSKTHITIEITNYGKLSGNDIAINKVKNEFNNVQSILGNMQANINEQVVLLNNSLPELIKKGIQIELDKIRKRNDSIDKL